jgi:hypothetical protein
MYYTAKTGEDKSHDTRNAIEALLAGRPVPMTTTRVFGCSTKWSDKRPRAVQALERWNAEEVTVQTIDAAGVGKLARNDSPNLRLIKMSVRFDRSCRLSTRPGVFCPGSWCGERERKGAGCLTRKPSP